MSLISTHKGVHVWLKKHGYAGKNSKSNVVDKILIQYKSDTGNNFHCWTFYHNRTFGNRWEQSRKEFKELTQWIIKTKQPNP